MLIKLITFEGIDGSGKSTQIKMLQQEFERAGIVYKSFREPGGTDLSEKIREILLDKNNIKLTSSSECLLFAAARAQLTKEQIRPAINRGEFVICDRFVDSTIAYQGYGRGLDLKYLYQINSFATDGLNPDITFILDLDSKDAKARLGENVLDRMEVSGMDFFDRIRVGYKKIMKKYPERCIEINANRTKEDIFNDIKKNINEKLIKEIKCD